MNIPHFGLKRQYLNLKDELLDATHRALKDGQLVGGHYTRSLEEWLKYKTKTQYALTVHSGTQALEIIAKYKLADHKAKLNYFSEKPTVKLPNLTYPATLNAFLSTGWNVELIDTDSYGVMTLKDEIVQIGRDYVCYVGLYGRQVNFGKTSSYNIIVDGAQHWLVADQNIGSGMAISFDPTKNLPASGNGGAIVTNDEHLYLYAVKYKDNFKPYFDLQGTNTKMSEQDCAQLLVRTKYIDEWQSRREKIAKYYIERFKNLPIRCLSDDKHPHAHQKFVIYTSERNSLHTHLLASGVDTKIHYEYVLSSLPIAENLKKPDMLATSMMLSKGVLSLPIYPELTDTEIDYICDQTIEYFNSK